MHSIDATVRIPDDVLANCDKEPIHIPGSIQPHGVLFALNPRDLTIEQVSDNVEGILGLAAGSILGQDISVALNQMFALRLRELVSRPDLSRPERIEFEGGGRKNHGVVHLLDDVLIVEIEPADDAEGGHASLDPMGQVHALHELLSLGTEGLSVRDFSQRLADYVRNLTGYDRVMVYRLDDRNNGEVIAEARDECIDSYLGHHFPASDIPNRARELYVRNRNRMLVDIDYRPAPVVPVVNPRTGRPLDMSLSTLRSVSPVHVEYLQNMGVKATLTISIVESGRLWGLIACHHYQPKKLSVLLRRTTELLSDYSSKQIFWHEFREQRQAEVARELNNTRLEAVLNSKGKRVENLFDHPDLLLGPLSATGAALSIAGEVTSAGDVPDEDSIARIVAWLERRSPDSLFHTNSLSILDPQFESIRELASGVLAVAISSKPPCYLIWFRHEKSRRIRWGGNPHKELVQQPNGVLRLTPRKSFETWVEVVRGYSDPWTVLDIDAARSIRLLIGIKRADDASRFKSQFLANMSHEIRTPMTAILGYADILLQEMEDLSAVDRRAMLETIKSSGAHLLSLIEDILDLSKIDADKLEVSRSPCSLAAIVRETISLMRVPAQSKGLTLSVEFEGPIPESIHTDSRRLRQVVLNLLGNAVKFTEAGQVRMVVRLDQSEPTLAMVVIDVIDTGVGLTEEQLTRVFEPFIQADSSTSRRFGGTGLGLAISKSLAEKLGGSLTAESRFGQGSTFRLRIDAGSLAGVRMHEGLTETTIGREPPAQTTKPPATGRLTGRVLLAEDHEVNQLLMSRLLTSAGAEVVIVENGKDAVETAMKHEAEGRPFVVILMDMQMPLMDGLEATAQLRSRGYSRPIIALTAGAMQGDREQCLKAGCDEYLTKPIKQQQLIAVVAAMEERQTREPGEISS